MSKPRKRRKPAGGRASGKAQSWAGHGQHAICLAPNQPPCSDRILDPLALFGGSKRYRVGMLLDDAGYVLPSILVVDNWARHVVTLSMEQAERWAANFAEEAEAAVIRGWVTTYRAEQVGIGGRA